MNDLSAPTLVCAPFVQLSKINGYKKLGTALRVQAATVKEIINALHIVLVHE